MRLSSAKLLRSVMKYQLADALIYTDDDATLTLMDSAESQQLTDTANAIFSLLVAHAGMVVERETFLREVWDRRGLQGSNNSLNQYISILRKMLAAMVPDTTFIVTVPKVGFMLSAELRVVRLGQPRSRPASVAISRRDPHWLALFCTLCTLVVCGTLLAWKQHKNQSDVFLLSHIGHCPVYTFAPLADVFRDRAVALATAIQQQGTFTCSGDAIFYLHIQDALFYGDSGRLVLSQCSHARGRASACRTLYYYNW